MSDDWMIPKEVAHELANLRAALSTARAELITANNKCEEFSIDCHYRGQALAERTVERDAARADQNKFDSVIRVLGMEDTEDDPAEECRKITLERDTARAELAAAQAPFGPTFDMFKAELATARAEAEAMREALKKAKQFVYVNGQGPEDQELLNCLEAALQAHRPHGEEK